LKGGGLFSDDELDSLGPLTKLFAMAYASVGIPLMLIYLGHCVRALKSLTSENGGGEWVGALLLGLGAMIFSGIALDVVENGDGPSSDDLVFPYFLFINLFFPKKNFFE
jgi:hypothetical protein